VKTTIEISDALLEDARRLAEREGVTLRSLVERGLHRVLTDAREQTPFQLRRASFKGAGLQAEFRAAAWERIRDTAYQDHGA
jgi:hypothetical protein